MIRFKCPHCAKVIQIADGSVGKKGKCPDCQQIIRIPRFELPDAIEAPNSVTTESAAEWAQSLHLADSVSPKTDSKPIVVSGPPQSPSENIAARMALGRAIGLTVRVAFLTGMVFTLFSYLAWNFFGSGLKKQAAKEIRQIQQQVAADYVTQYEIARQSGTAMDAYVRAGLCAEAYLQLHDEGNFAKWKDIQNQEAIRAGITIR